MEKMELVLQSDLESMIPAMIAWNNEELMAQVKELLVQYDNTVYDESNITQAKEDRARLNKFADALNSERLAIKKRYVAPLDKFTAEVNEVVGAVNSASMRIVAVVTEYDAKKRAEKRRKVQEHYDVAIGDLRDCVPYERLEDTRWYNASVSLKSATTEIDVALERIRNELIAIDALQSPDDAQIKAYYFRTLSLAQALQENERLKEERRRAEAYSARVQAAQAQQETSEVTVNIETSGCTQAAPKLLTVRFAVQATAEQLKALKAFLTAHKMDFKPI